MSEIESAYKESYKRNKDMLTFYQALIIIMIGLMKVMKVLEVIKCYGLYWKMI